MLSFKKLLMVLSSTILVLSLLSGCGGSSNNDGGGGGGDDVAVYSIQNPQELGLLAERVKSGETFKNKTIRLTSNISMAGVPFNGFVRSYAPDGSDFFQGTFDGDNFTLSGVTILSTADNVGFIGALGVGGKVINLNLDSISITGGNNVGGVVGLNKGTLENVSVTKGTITGSDYVGGVIGVNTDNCSVMNVNNTSDVSGRAFIGGIVGSNNNGGSLKNTENNGKVTGSNDFVGGIAGENIKISSIETSSNMGIVAGLKAVGGIAGENDKDSSVKNASNTGEVNGTKNVGGVVGSNGGAVDKVYNIGVVTASEFVGGVIGDNKDIGGNAGTLVNGYYLSNTSVNIGLGDAAGGVVKDINGFKVEDLTGFSKAVWGNNDVDINGVRIRAVIKAIWDRLNPDKPFLPMGSILTFTANGGLGDNATIEDKYIGDEIELPVNHFNAPSGYVFVSWNTKADGTGVDYNEKATFLIEDGNITIYAKWKPTAYTIDNYGKTDVFYIVAPQQLLDLSKLVEDNGSVTFFNKQILLLNDIDMAGVEFYGLWRNYNEGSEYFEGEFHGDNYTISNMTIDFTTNSGGLGNVGLIGVVNNGGEIKHLNLYNSKIVGSNNVGSFAGLNYGVIDNVSNIGSVEGNHWVGGIAGKNVVDKGVIRNAGNKGTVKANNNFVGGIVGENSGHINKVQNLSDVIGWDNVGGVAGASEGFIDNASNAGSVTATQLTSSVGGVVGSLDGKMSYVYNIGAVSDANNAGGVVGYNVDEGFTGMNKKGFFLQISNGVNAHLDVGDLAGYEGLNSVNFIMNFLQINDKEFLTEVWVDADFKTPINGVTKGIVIKSIWDKLDK